MASRRTTAGHKGGEREIRPGHGPLPNDVDEGQSVPLNIIVKMLGFTLAMVTGPISTYYLTRDYVYKGNATYAGATAAIMANVILLAYVIVALREDQSDAIEAREKEKKAK